MDLSMSKDMRDPKRANVLFAAKHFFPPKSSDTPRWGTTKFVVEFALQFWAMPSWGGASVSVCLKTGYPNWHSFPVPERSERWTGGFGSSKLGLLLCWFGSVQKSAVVGHRSRLHFFLLGWFSFLILWIGNLLVVLYIFSSFHFFWNFFRFRKTSLLKRTPFPILPRRCGPFLDLQLRCPLSVPVGHVAHEGFRSELWGSEHRDVFPGSSSRAGVDARWNLQAGWVFTLVALW